MLDSIPHIIDSSRIVIQNIIPGKSWWEINAPYVAVIVSLLTVIVNIWLNNRQIKNSHHILEKNIEANWKNSIKGVRLQNELKMLGEFKEATNKFCLIIDNVSVFLENRFRLNYIDSSLYYRSDPSYDDIKTKTLEKEELNKELSIESISEFYDNEVTYREHLNSITQKLFEYIDKSTVELFQEISLTLLTISHYISFYSSNVKMESPEKYYDNVYKFKSNTIKIIDNINNRILSVKNDKNN